MSEDVWLLFPDFSDFQRESQQVCETLRTTGSQLTFAPPRMTRALFISLFSCLVAINQASVINRCDLAKLLHQEDLDGFEGYSVSDCECHFLSPAPISPVLVISYWPSFFLSLVFESQVQKAAPSKTPFPTFHINSTIIHRVFIIYQELF